jgi:hypothetical protein
MLSSSPSPPSTLITSQLQVKTLPRLLPLPLPAVAASCPLLVVSSPSPPTHLQAFLSSAHSQSHFAGGALPPELAAQMSVADKMFIRNRSTILARHVYADMGDRFADEQVRSSHKGDGCE